jgi:2-iminobutanoate/2-iminopropanoate deaminase
MTANGTGNARSSNWHSEFERDYAPLNRIYLEYFPSDRLPARTTVGVTHLARGGIVEIDMIAYRPRG